MIAKEHPKEVLVKEKPRTNYDWSEVNDDEDDETPEVIQSQQEPEKAVE